MSPISDPPIFSSTCIHTCLYRGFVLVRGGLCAGVCLGFFCLEGFVRGGFCSSPLLSECIHYNRKLNITFNFRFHMYNFFLKCDVTCSWTTSLLSQTVTPSWIPSPPFICRTTLRCSDFHFNRFFFQIIIPLHVMGLSCGFVSRGLPNLFNLPFNKPY